MTESTPVLHVEALTKGYGRSRGIEGVGLTVGGGERFGLLGPNGSGKTTLIRLVLGLLRPDSGRVTVDGHDVAHDRAAALAQVGYLPGELGLMGDLSGARTLEALGALHPRPPVRRGELLDVLELSDRDLRRPVRQYSRGMKQKIGLVAALQHDPPVVILDEPTGGLDPVVQNRLLAWLRGLRERGSTVIFSSHIISEVEALCDRVAMLRDGRLVAVERVSDLERGSGRRVEVRFAAPTGLDVLGEGCSDLQEGDGGRHHTFVWHGPPAHLLGALAALDPVDVRIAPPALEDVFARLYGAEVAR